MFFVAEFLHAFTISALFATLFLGGWQGPYAEAYPVLGLVYFLIKTSLVYFVVIWIRGSFPRFRIDQINSLNWKMITPIALGAIIFAAITEKLVQEMGLNQFLAHATANVILIVIIFVSLHLYARAARKAQTQKDDRAIPVSQASPIE